MKTKLATALLFFALIAPCLAGPADRIVGYYTSSSGAPVSIAYGVGDTVSIIIEVPHQGRTEYTSTPLTADGGRFSYQSSDGSTINAWVNADGSINVSNPVTGWEATWRRNR